MERVGGAIRNPNEKLWENYERYSLARGSLVATVLAVKMKIDGAQILDVGCGHGGIAVALAKQGALLTAVDIDPERIAVLEKMAEKENVKIAAHCTSVEDFSTNEKYDAIILADVLEHVSDYRLLITTLYEKLKPGGWLYLTTPNKWSVFNFFCDPHFSLPVVSILKRSAVKSIVADFLHWQDPNRPDFPQLLGNREIFGLFEKNWNWSYVHKRVVKYAFNHPASIWSRPFHLECILFFKKIRLYKILQLFVSDKKGLLNNCFMPTWYILAQRDVKNLKR